LETLEARQPQQMPLVAVAVLLLLAETQSQARLPVTEGLAKRPRSQAPSIAAVVEVAAALASREGLAEREAVAWEARQQPHQRLAVPTREAGQEEAV
jgi:hypothetical protein